MNKAYYSKHIDKFEKYFNVRNNFIDGMISVIAGSYVFDVIKFDEYMIRQYNYDQDKYSLQEFITMQFGKQASEFISELLD